MKACRSMVCDGGWVLDGRVAADHVIEVLIDPSRGGAKA
jgi:hypothetical protein